MSKFGCVIIGVMVMFASCIEERDTEVEQPKITLISPMPCDTLYFGEPFNYIIKIEDNTGLGGVSMDLHNNFGHHSHGGHAACAMDPVKDPVNPYTESWIFNLPEDSLEYTFETEIVLTDMKDDSTLFDNGDYHFHLYVTDNDGYQVFTSFGVKILNR